MKLNIRGDKVEITPAIREHIENKIAKLDRYFSTPDDLTCHILVRVRGQEQIIEVTVPTKKFTLRAEESHNDLYASVDLVLDKLERQIRKNKTKLNKFKHEQQADEISYDYLSQIEEEPEITEEMKIVKRKNIESKPMDEEEAILQMDLLNHDFFIFKNIDEDCTSVIYLRKDGSYGLINMK